MAVTKVGRHKVEVKAAKYLSIVTFSAGARGKKECGDYAFWTAMFKEPVEKRRKVLGRAHLLLPPGDRFDRIGAERINAKTKEDRAAYARIWRFMKGGKNIKYIRPSTEKEIKRWMNGHQSDAKFVIRKTVGGKILRK